MDDCLFCKFISKEYTTNIVFENDDMIIFRDIEPKAKNHFLAVPKKHFKYIADATAEDGDLIGRMLRTISSLTKELELENGYRLVINQGDDAGQTVGHLHIHILSGQKMGWTPA